MGHINVDHIVQTDAKPALAAPLVALEKMLMVDGTHLIVPMSNAAKGPGNVILLGIYDGEKLVQDFTVRLPQGDAVSWLAVAGSRSEDEDTRRRGDLEKLSGWPNWAEIPILAAQ